MVFSPSGSGEVTLDINANDNASESIDGIAGSLGSMRKAAAGAGLAMTAIGVGGMAKATSAAIDFDEAMTEVEKVTSAVTAQNLEDDIRDIAESTRLAHGEVAELASQAARFGAEGEKEIAKFTRAAAEMGAATTLNTNEAGKQLAKLSTALGEPIGEVRTLGDAVNELSNNFAANSQEIVDSAKRSGQSLQALGLETDQILGLSAAINEVAPSSSKAATMMRKLGNAMMDPDNVATFAEALGMTEQQFIKMREENPQKAMKQLGEAMASGGESSRLLSEQLTKRQVRAFRRVGSQADKLSKTQQTANKAMSEGGSLAQENATDTASLAGQMDILQSRLTTAAQKIGEQLLPALIKIIDAVMPVLDAFLKLNDATNGMAGVAVLLGTALSGLAITIAAIAPVITGTLIPAFTTAAGFVTSTLIPALGSVVAVLGGPLTVAILAIVAVVGGLYLAWKTNFLGMRDIINDVVGQVVDAFNFVKKVLSQVFEKYAMPLIKRLQKLWKQNFQDIANEAKKTMKFLGGIVKGGLNVVLSIFKTVGGLISGFWSKHGDKVIKMTKVLFAALELVFGTALDAIMTTVKVFLALLRGDWSQALDYVVGYFERTFDRITKFFSAWITSMEAQLNLVFGVIKDIFEGIYNFLIGNSIVPDTFNAILDFITNDFFKGLKSILNKVFDFYKEIWTSIFDTTKNIFNTLVKWVKKGLTAYFDFWKDLFNNVFDFYKEIWTTIFDTTKNILNETTKFVKKGLNSYFDFWKNLFNNVFDFYEGIWTSIFDTAKDLLNKTTKFIKKGLNAYFTFWKDLFSKVFDFYEGVWTKIFNTAKNILNDVVSFVKTSLNAYFNFWKKTFNKVFNFYRSIWNKIKSTTKKVWNKIESIIASAWSAVQSTVSTTLDAILNTFKGIFNSIMSFVEGIMSDIQSTISGALSSVASTVSGWGRTLANSFGDAFRDAYNTVTDWMSDIYDGVTDVMDNITDFIGDAVYDVADIAGDMADELTDAISDGLDDIERMFNRAIPNYLRIPEVEVGGGDIDIPSVRVGGGTFMGKRIPSKRIGGGDIDIPEVDVGGQRLDLPQLAEGGIVDSATLAMIGEGSQAEAVVPLDKLNTMMEMGASRGATGAGAGGKMEVSLKVEGDDKLAEIIRENAEVVVEDNEESKQERVKRFR